MSAHVDRTLSLARWTDPLTTSPTPSAPAISRIVGLSRYWNTVLEAITRRPATLPSSVVTASVMPSARYGLPLPIVLNGSTARAGMPVASPIAGRGPPSTADDQRDDARGEGRAQSGFEPTGQRHIRRWTAIAVLVVSAWSSDDACLVYIGESLFRILEQTALNRACESASGVSEGREPSRDHVPDPGERIGVPYWRRTAALPTILEQDAPERPDIRPPVHR